MGRATLERAKLIACSEVQGSLMRHSACDTAICCFVGQRTLPPRAQLIIYPRLPSFTRSHHHRHRSDAAITHTFICYPPSSLSSSCPQAQRCFLFTSPSVRCCLYNRAFHSFLPQPPRTAGPTTATTLPRLRPVSSLTTTLQPIWSTIYTPTPVIDLM